MSHFPNISNCLILSFFSNLSEYRESMIITRSNDCASHTYTCKAKDKSASLIISVEVLSKHDNDDFDNENRVLLNVT